MIALVLMAEDVMENLEIFIVRFFIFGVKGGIKHVS